MTLQAQQAEHITPLIELNEADTHTGEIWIRGNFALLNLNLSRKILSEKNPNSSQSGSSRELFNHRNCERISSFHSTSISINTFE